MSAGGPLLAEGSLPPGVGQPGIGFG